MRPGKEKGLQINIGHTAGERLFSFVESHPRVYCYADGMSVLVTALPVSTS